MMMLTTMNRGFAIGAFALSLAGCSASSDYMREVAVPHAPGPVPDKATVVFVRPSSFGSAIKVTVLDDQGHFMGDSLPSSYFTKELDPGKHLFLSWAENTDGLDATLAAGKVYFVEVEIKMGALSARAHLKALKPSSERWPKRQEWLTDSKELSVDDQGGQAYLDGRKDDVTERIRRAHDAMTKYDPGEISERTLVGTDGI